MAQLAAVVLAAGKGTRMKSALAKVLHPVAGRPLVAWPVAAARAAGVERQVLVVGHQGEAVAALFAKDADIRVALQAEQLGTGHAVACALPYLDPAVTAVLILCGDVPLLRPESLRELVAHHHERQAAVTVLSVRLDDPTGYGRILRDGDGQLARIVEEKDATPAERRVNEINTGIYCVAAGFLGEAVARMENNNAQGEYYLTDIVPLALAAGHGVETVTAGEPTEFLGVNDRAQLAEVGRLLRRRINRELLLAGVSMVDPEQTYIDHGVQIGADTYIAPNVHIHGATVIGGGCVLEPGVVLRDCRLGERVTVKAGSVLTEAVVHEEVAIGPMAHLRPGTVLHPHVKIGNFVETKQAELLEGAKASHLTYLGDASIGREVNIGCGTITCNYDGVRKHRTVIEDGVFVGSDVQLVAPVTVGRNALIAAGTTVTRDVPAEALAIARTPQVNKEGWTRRQKP